MMPLTIDKQEAILFAIRFMLSSDPMGQYQKRADAVRVLEGMLQEAAESPRIDAEVRQTFRPSEGRKSSLAHQANPDGYLDEDGLGPENNPEPKVRFQASPTKPMRGPLIDDLSQKGIILPLSQSDARPHLISYLRAHMTLAQMKEQLADKHGIHFEEETILRCLAGLTA